MREHVLILNDAYFSRDMVYSLVKYDVLLRCVSTKAGRKLEVVLEGKSDDIDRYMVHIGATRAGYSFWVKGSVL